VVLNILNGLWLLLQSYIFSISEGPGWHFVLRPVGRSVEGSGGHRFPLFESSSKINWRTSAVFGIPAK
jgi:hypothetical protein